MTVEWITSPAARKVLMHWGDTRPAWLWSADGSTLVWRNAAARAFYGKLKKNGVKLAPDVVPLKGQVARLIRLGSLNRSSLSRVQFLANGHPVSATCAVTPLALADTSIGLLVVGVDPIEPELLSEAKTSALTESLLPEGSQYLLIDDGQVTGGSPHALAAYAPQIESEGLPEVAEGVGALSVGDETLTLRLFEASPHGAQLVLLTGGMSQEPGRRIDAVRAEEGLREADMAPAGEDVPEPPTQPLLPIGLPQVETPAEPSAGAQTLDEHWVEPFEPRPEIPGLANLFDRLADDEGLYAPLTESDDTFAGPLHENVGYVPPAAPPPEPELEAEPEPAFVQPEPAAPAEVAAPPADELPEADQAAEPQDPGVDMVGDSADIIAAVIAFADEDEDQPPDFPPTLEAAPAEEAPPALVEDAAPPPEPIEPTEPETRVWKVTGRGFMPLAAEPPVPETADADESEQPDAIAAEREPDVEAGEIEAAEPAAPTLVSSEEPATRDASDVDQVSRYNFDELSRILSDRVGSEAPALVAPPAAAQSRGDDSSLINLAGDTFILNRLPIGIMVFRDQQVLFANRALTDLVGYESVDALRQAGLGAIFPASDAAGAGPVTSLLRRDGDAVAVRARLQSVPWQGRPALMLSALSGEEPRGHEASVVAFAGLVAGAHEEGFIRADRSGVFTEISLHARVVLGRTEEELLGTPLAALLDDEAVAGLREFLERPARFAETARPSFSCRTKVGNAEMLLFAEGQAGLVSGYFGFLRQLTRTPSAGPAAAAAATQPGFPGEEIEPSMLVRLSRGIRRPLNTIIGFSDLIRSAAFGSIENGRYLEYARDIKTAGSEIATLVDELDDYARLREGRYATRPAELDLGALLESCVVRVRGQASAARVLVRSAISERLPRIRADRASLGQAILNLLASAIDQTPAGASVILSAQVEDDGSISVNVRDSSESQVDLGERFVVFRDGVGKNGEALAPVRSSVGLALTRSLLAVNTCRLSVDPSGGVGLRFSMVIPADLVASN